MEARFSARSHPSGGLKRPNVGLSWTGLRRAQNGVVPTPARNHARLQEENSTRPTGDFELW